MANVQYRGTGRRKSSVARVILTPGTGNFVINGKEAREYLASDVLNMIVNQPLELTNTKDKFDVTVNVYGGGYSGQAGAIRHGPQFPKPYIIRFFREIHNAQIDISIWVFL